MTIIIYVMSKEAPAEIIVKKKVAEVIQGAETIK
jgi:hypothetical protein